MTQYFVYKVIAYPFALVVCQLVLLQNINIVARQRFHHVFVDSVELLRQRHHLLLDLFQQFTLVLGFQFVAVILGNNDLPFYVRNPYPKEFVQVV